MLSIEKIESEMIASEMITIKYEGKDVVCKKIPVTESDGESWFKLETEDGMVPIIWTERWEKSVRYFDNIYAGVSRFNRDSEMIRMAVEPEYMNTKFSEFFEAHGIEGDDSFYEEHFQKFIAWVFGCDEDLVPWTLADFHSVRLEFLKEGEYFRIYVSEGFCTFEKLDLRLWNRA